MKILNYLSACFLFFMRKKLMLFWKAFIIILNLIGIMGVVFFQSCSGEKQGKTFVLKITLSLSIVSGRGKREANLTR